MKSKQGSVLLDLMIQHHVKRFAEIGVWRSHTVDDILKNKPDCLEEYWAVDSWLRAEDPAYGHYHTMSQEEWDKIHLKCCRRMLFYPVLRVLKVTHEAASKIFPRSYFDLVFLDADHFLGPTLSQINHWLPLVKTDGLLTGHGFMRRRPEVEKAVRLRFGNNFERLEATVWVHRVK